jgi:adenine-specific DNA methylase
LELIAKIFDCYFMMEALARYPYPSHSAEAFKNDEAWNKVKQSAKEAADALEPIRKGEI